MVANYRKDIFRVRSNRDEAIALPLMSGNPASAVKLFTLEFALASIQSKYGDRVHSRYIDIDNYRAPIDLMNFDAEEGEGGERIYFPGEAFCIDILFRNDNDFFKLPVDQLTTSHTEDVYAITTSSNELKVHRDDVLENPTLQKGKQRIAQLFKDKTPLEKHVIRNSPEVLDILLSVGYNEEKSNPGGYLLDCYLAEKMQDPNYSPTAVYTPNLNVDSSLTEFGNFIVSYGLLLEAIGAVSVLHREIIMLSISALGSGDIETEKMRLHFLFLGIPASGKSFTVEFLKDLCVKGLTHEVTTQSKKANTTSTSYNGLIMTMDEFQDVIMEDKTKSGGNGEIKTLLTKGSLATETLMLDAETGDRNINRTISNKRCAFIGCSNASGSRFPNGIFNRFIPVNVPYQNREDVDVVSMMEDIKTNPEKSKKFQILKDRHQFSQSVANILWRILRLRIIDGIQTNVVSQCVNKTFEYLLKTFNMKIEVRHKFRINMMVEYCTIFFAINKVFFSGTVIPHGTPFKFQQIFQCIPYLVARREFFYFTLTLFNDVIINPYIVHLAKAIKWIIAKQLADVNLTPPEQQDIYFKDPVTHAINLNYYFVPVHALVKHDNMEEIVCKIILQAISQSSTFSVGANEIEECLKSLFVMQYKCNLFLEVDTFEGSGELQFQTVVNKKTSGTKCGYGFHRGFIDFFAGNCNILDKLIQATLDPHMEETRFVKGVNYRHGGVDSDDNTKYPFLFEIAEFSQDEKNSQPLLTNTNFKMAGSEKLFYGNSTEGQQDDTLKKFMLLDENLDDYERKKWEAIVGCKQGGDDGYVFLKDKFPDQIYAYPDEIMRLHKQSLVPPTVVQQQPDIFNNQEAATDPSLENDTINYSTEALQQGGDTEEEEGGGDTEEEEGGGDTEEEGGGDTERGGVNIEDTDNEEESDDDTGEMDDFIVPDEPKQIRMKARRVEEKEEEEVPKRRRVVVSDDE